MEYRIKKETLQEYLVKNGREAIIENKKYTSGGFLHLIRCKPEISETLAVAIDYTVHNGVFLSAQRMSSF